MKNYIKPLMHGQLFVANEYVGACSPTTTISCIDMENAKVIYKDANNNGELDLSEISETNKYTGWDIKNDCFQHGSSSGEYHIVGDVGTQLYFVGMGSQYTTANYTYVPVYLDSKGGEGEDKPHFISKTTVTNAS